MSTAEEASVTRSVSFDRAADTYDATRALPEDIAAKQTDALVAELTAANARLLLEIGIGTGRIARPLAARGVRVFGVDIAARMLARLRDQLDPSAAPLDIALGDATRLPLAPNAVGAALIVHVLHLVADWRATLSEIARVIAPGGVFLHPVANYPEPNPWALHFRKRVEILGSLGYTARRRPERSEIAAELRRLGASFRSAPFAEEEERTTPRFWLERTRDRVDSWSWEVPDDVFPEFLARYEAWNREYFGDLDVEVASHGVHEIEVWQFA